jgi:Superinfection immunity protein
MEGFAAISFLLLGLAFYFLPAIIARNKRNATAIFWLNFLLGWSLVGWVIALVWALTNDPQPAVVQPYHAPQLAASILCSSCGKYSVGDARFCQTCGQPLHVAPLVSR